MIYSPLHHEGGTKMEIKIMLTAAVFFGGWLLSYVFLRQLLFNFRVAYPLLNKMNEIDPELIAPGARRYTNTSVVVCIVGIAVFCGVVVFLCPKYLIISFFVGVALCLVMILGKLTPANQAMFESFCSGYCRFVPDDELRTIMYNKEYKKINRRLRELSYGSSFVPEFRDKT